MESDEVLLRIFDDDRNAAEEKCRALLRRLIRHLRWKRCRNPEDVAMEALQRGFSKIAAGKEVGQNPVHYFLAIADFVALEDFRAFTRKSMLSLEAALPSMIPIDFRNPDAAVLLREYLEQLPPDERELLVRYHTEDPVNLAVELKMREGTLRVKAFRAKEKLNAYAEKLSSKVSALK